MANPSISVDDEVLKEFDEIRETKEDELGPGVSIARSSVIEELMKSWIEENSEYLDEGNPMTMAVAD